MRKLLLFLSFLLFVFLSCDNELTINDLDPNADDFDPPETLIESGPSDGQTITINTATFTFSGNELVSEFSYKLVFESQSQDDVDWSGWSSDMEVTLEMLDEGSYTFYVKGQYPTGDEDPTPASTSFTVDAVTGSSIRVFPITSSTNQFSIITIDVYAEDVENVAGIEVEMHYNSDILEIYGSIEKGQMLNMFSGTDIVIDELDDGNIKVTIGLVEGTLSGTGVLFSVNFNAQSLGASDIIIYSAQYKDGSNNDIDINQIISGAVNVQ